MNQSGIRKSEALAETLTDLPSTLRTLKISIQNEALEPNGQQSKCASFQQDFDALSSLVEDSEAAYLMIRQDDDKFVFVSYVPDTAKVREKMLYASTRNTLSREFGTDKIASTYFATTKEELTFAAFAKQSEDDEKPLTEKEKELQDVKDAEEQIHATGAKQQIAPTGSGLKSKISSGAQEALAKLKTASASRAVVLRIDPKTEVLELAADKEVDLDGVASVLPKDGPAYLFYSYVHEYEGVETTSQIFLYLCPDSAPVKERMIYSSNRSSVTQAADFKLDVRYEAEELDVADLKSRIHPPKQTCSSGFARPRRPGKK
jgi:twinfilin-like protein